jgi:hypothetical protein
MLQDGVRTDEATASFVQCYPTNNSCCNYTLLLPIILPQYYQVLADVVLARYEKRSNIKTHGMLNN